MKERWEPFVVNESVLMQHQRDAVYDMLERDERGVPGHFVVGDWSTRLAYDLKLTIRSIQVLDVGLGKTLLTATYIRHFLSSTSEDIGCILWITPTDLVDPTVKQLSLTWKLPALQLKPWDKPRAGYINMVAHDALRKKPKASSPHAASSCTWAEHISRIAHRMVVVFDEVDTMYANTQRTSGAHCIASCAAKIVCQVSAEALS